ATIGGVLLIEKGFSFWPAIWAWRPAHIQMLLLGWIVQFACGTAIWILPRLNAAGDRGDLRPVWLAYVVLNSGVLLVSLHAPLRAFTLDAWLGWMPLLAVFCYALAIGAIALHAWRRVVAFGA
ncbi:MAG TPA: hypothetical protein PKC19_17795, partial [Roseiflexaceae bacterium]|nr:hypothetical protein [Roseiflexaceae bacterium]